MLYLTNNPSKIEERKHKHPWFLVKGKRILTRVNCDIFNCTLEYLFYISKKDLPMLFEYTYVLFYYFWMTIRHEKNLSQCLKFLLVLIFQMLLFFWIAGGYLSNSLAIATDAAHLLTDFASFMISLFAIWIAGRPSTRR